MHPIVPFLLIGVGCDDMFVICNAIDQTPDEWSPAERFRVALSHAGPSITITSFTNALAFYFGSFTSLVALNSFCIHAGVSILMLYATLLSIFSCFMVWDLQRMHKKRGDCCFRCCNERLCCNGALLTEKQKKFSGIFEGISEELNGKKTLTNPSSEDPK